MSATAVLSGGSFNSDPTQSLGGVPSSTHVTTGENNLFSDVTTTQAQTGYTDYRCFYVFNDTGVIWNNIELWLSGFQISTATVGMLIQNEIQLLTVVGDVIGGNLSLSLDGFTTGPIFFASEINILMTSIQSELQALPNSAGAIVSQYATDVFQVQWAGVSGGRKYPLLQLVDNNLIPPNVSPPLPQPTIQITELTAGSPINAVATDVGLPTLAPVGITFSTPLQSTPLVLNSLQPAEGFPVWICRTVPVNAVNGPDGVTCNVQYGD